MDTRHKSSKKRLENLSLRLSIDASISLLLYLDLGVSIFSCLLICHPATHSCHPSTSGRTPVRLSLQSLVQFPFVSLWVPFHCSSLWSVHISRWKLSEFSVHQSSCMKKSFYGWFIKDFYYFCVHLQCSFLPVSNYSLFYLIYLSTFQESSCHPQVWLYFSFWQLQLQAHLAQSLCIFQP